jgi:hypothetical protein
MFDVNAGRLGGDEGSSPICRLVAGSHQGQDFGLLAVSPERSTEVSLVTPGVDARRARRNASICPKVGRRRVPPRSGVPLGARRRPGGAVATAHRLRAVVPQPSPTGRRVAPPRCSPALWSARQPEGRRLTEGAAFAD